VLGVDHPAAPTSLPVLCDDRNLTALMVGIIIPRRALLSTLLDPLPPTQHVFCFHPIFRSSQPTLADARHIQWLTRVMLHRAHNKGDPSPA
jgi:hypothetical protein